MEEISSDQKPSSSSSSKIFLSEDEMKGSKGLLNRSTISDLNISLHPLTILNISDHLTRSRLKRNDKKDSKSSPNIGVLIGTQVGRKLEIVNSFEILVDSKRVQDGVSVKVDNEYENHDDDEEEEEEEEFVVNHEFLITRQEQFKQVFPNLDCLGYYMIEDQEDDKSLKKKKKSSSNNNNGPNKKLFKIQRQLIDNFENLFSNSNLLLIYNPEQLNYKERKEKKDRNDLDGDDEMREVEEEQEEEQEDEQDSSRDREQQKRSQDLGIQIFEFIQLQSNYLSCRFEIETSEIEQIAVDYIAKPMISNKDSSGIIESLMTQRNAIKMFHSRLRVILNYLNKIVTKEEEDDDDDRKGCKEDEMDMVGGGDLSKEKKKDRVEVDHEVLRQISSLVNCLPNFDLKDGFNREFKSEFNDSLLSSYLSSQTEALNEVNQLIDRIIYVKMKEQRMSATEGFLGILKSSSSSSSSPSSSGLIGGVNGNERLKGNGSKNSNLSVVNENFSGSIVHSSSNNDLSSGVKGFGVGKVFEKSGLGSERSGKRYGKK